MQAATDHPGIMRRIIIRFAFLAIGRSGIGDIGMMTVCTTKACIVVLSIFLCSQMVPGAISDQDAEISQLIDALKGESAVAEWHASQRLMELGDAAVPVRAQLVSTPGRLAPRLVDGEVCLTASSQRERALHQNSVRTPGCS